MMKKQNILQPLFASVVALLAVIISSTSAMAHPGHDHAANTSMLVHVLFYGSIVAVVAACAWFAYRQFSKQKSK